MGRVRRASESRQIGASAARAHPIVLVHLLAALNAGVTTAWTRYSAAYQSIQRRAVEVWRNVQMPVATAIAYYIGAQAAFFIGTLSDNIFAPFWPPNIVLFCALVLTPYRRWWLYLLAALPAHVLAEIEVGMPALQIAVAFITNTSVAVLNAAAIKWAYPGPPWFSTLRNAGLYVLLTAVAGPAIASFGGAFVPITGGGSFDDYGTFWAQWFMCNALGSLTLGPIALICLGERDSTLSLRSARRIAEAVFVSVALVVVCAAAFQISATNSAKSFLPALLYTPLPLVLWAAIRFGVQGAGSALLIVAVVLIWRTLNGPSLFLAGSSETNVFAMQAFLVGLAVPVLLLGAAIDEARHAEQEVRESEERMAFAAASANLCLWRFDYGSERFWITDHGRDMLGFRPDEHITRAAIIDTIHPEDRDAARDSLRAAIAADRLADYEFRIVRRDGAIRWFRCRARAHKKEAERPAYIGGTFADITEQKTAEIELTQQRQELAHLTRVSMLGELSGGIAHELMQPLSAILSNAEAARILIARNPPELDEVAEILSDIISEDHRAGEVILRLRRLLKKSEAKFEPVDLNDLIISTLRLLHNETINRRVRFATALARDLPLVSGDAVQLQQVLLNLVLNAMDAMNKTVPSQRTIIVGTQAVGDGAIEVLVSDRGTGLTPSQRERVFQPFFTTKEHGLGLGLSLSSAIIKLHGGDLDIDNNASGGATASFRLPNPLAAEVIKFGAS
jgi:PAS domain S-box-containing protein